MSVIGIVSMKGGVGKTSLTANLATVMATKLGGNRVSVVDLDPQNALQLHFGINNSKGDGVSKQSICDGDWRNIAFSSEFNVVCMPYGIPNELDRKFFEKILSENPDWVAKQLKQTGFCDDAVVLIDTPPGPSVYLKQVFECADIILVVLLADAGSYATIPAMEAWLEDMLALHPQLRSVYVINQLDRSTPLSRDVADKLHFDLGDSIAPIGIHCDEAVSEALAFLKPVLTYDPHGQASHDYAQLASWLIDTLNR
jgi:cellulose synthase operon protein YhjQ